MSSELYCITFLHQFSGILRSCKQSHVFPLLLAPFWQITPPHGTTGITFGKLLFTVACQATDSAPVTCGRFLCLCSVQSVSPETQLFLICYRENNSPQRFVYCWGDAPQEKGSAVAKYKSEAMHIKVKRKSKNLNWTKVHLDGFIY